MLRAADAPTGVAVGYTLSRSIPGESEGRRAHFERALQLEIHQLRARIEELKHELDVLQSDPTD